MRTDYLVIRADARLEDILRSFAQAHVTSAPVMDGTEFLGLVSDAHIVDYLQPKKFKFIFKRGSAKPLDGVRSLIAAKLVSKPSFTLSPEQELASVLGKIAQRVDCMPVLEKGRLVGLVRGEDLVEFFLQTLAQDAYSQSISEAEKGAAVSSASSVLSASGASASTSSSASKTDSSSEDSASLDTEMDRVLDMVRECGEVPCSQISKDLNLSIRSVERVCEVLAHHHLITMNYSFLKGPIAKKVDHAK